MGKVPSLEAAGGMQGGLFGEKPFNTRLCPHPAPIHPQPHNRAQLRD